MGIQKPNMQALWADQGAIIAPTDSKVRLGWTAEVPPNQWENWVQNRQDRALAYLMQKGIPEWDSATEYIANKSFVQKDGKIYKCIATNTGNDPVTRSTFWDSGIGLGLGTAAYSSLTTSNTDTTAGRVLKVGDYGLGTQSTLPDGTGFSTLPVGGNYQISGSHPDAPSAGGGSLHVGGTSSLKTYLYVQNNTRKVYVKSDTSQWTELWSGLNFNPSDKADKTTTISAGTGLSGGGDLSQNRSLSVEYGTTANTSAQGNDTRIVNSLQKNNNLSDLNSASAARTNLGLGNSATLNVGTAASTVAAGNDSRIVGSAQKSANLGDLSNISTARSNLGLGSSATTNLATQAQAQALSANNVTITPKTLGDSMNAHVLGMGQTWQNKSSVRAPNTTYTNTTGRLVAVSAIVKGYSVGALTYFRVDDVAIASYKNQSINESTTPARDNQSFLFVLVPSGSEYRIDLGVGHSIHAWVEFS